MFGANKHLSLKGLDWLNFLLADVQGGVGPFLAIYLWSSQGWDATHIGIIMTIAGIATVAARAPAGALRLDRLEARSDCYRGGNRRARGDCPQPFPVVLASGGCANLDWHLRCGVPASDRGDKLRDRRPGSLHQTSWPQRGLQPRRQRAHSNHRGHCRLSDRARRRVVARGAARSNERLSGALDQCGRDQSSFGTRIGQQRLRL
jgi:hypothetical protein